MKQYVSKLSCDDMHISKISPFGINILNLIKLLQKFLSLSEIMFHKFAMCKLLLTIYFDLVPQFWIKQVSF